MVATGSTVVIGTTGSTVAIGVTARTDRDEHNPQGQIEMSTTREDRSR
jgi:hypothetical protein